MQRALRTVLDGYAEVCNVPDGFAHLQHASGSSSVTIPAPVHHPYSHHGYQAQVAAMVVHADDEYDEVDWDTDSSDETV